MGNYRDIFRICTKMCKSMYQIFDFTYTPMDEVVRVCDSEDEELSFGDRMKTPFLIIA